MSVKNLHSILNGRWFIEQQYGHSLLPLLYSILEGKKFDSQSNSENEEDDLVEANFFVVSKNSSKVAVKNFSSQNQQDKYVGIINFKSPIYKYSQECGPAGTKAKMAQMQMLADDPNCLGVVLDIDSGGGQVSGTPEFHDFVKSFPKPVVSYTDGLMCSAAYYIGSAADHIIANKRADAIGSIGVMVSFFDLTGYYEKLGAKKINEYSTLSSEKNKAFEELLKGKPELYIKTELDPIAEQFIEDIKSVRSNVPEEVFKGGTWDANGSLKNNLVDELGSLQDAIDKVYELSSASTKTNNKNSKKKTMSKKTKSFPLIQGILGRKEEGFATISTVLGNKGIQIKEADLQSIENAIEEKDKAVATANGKVTTAESKVTELDSAVNAAITAAGLDSEVEANATTAAKITLLQNKVIEYGKRPGTTTTKTKSEGDKVNDDDDDETGKSTSIFESVTK